MNAILFLAVIVAVFGSGLAQTRPPPDPCRTCQIIVNIARHHFNNTVYTQADLQAQLLMECDRLAQFEGQAASDHCKQVVNNNIATIFNDMSTNKTPLQTCQDVGECPQKAVKAQVQKRDKRQRPHDPCRTCEIIVNIARHHFNNTVYTQADLQAQLLKECMHLGSVEGPAAGANCTAIVNQYIAQIFADMSSHKTSRQTCQDIHQCPMIIKRQKRQAHNPCRTCEIIVGIAKRHFHNNFTDQGALQTQLLAECQNLINHGFTADEVANCVALVNNNMPAIYQEMVNNPTAPPMKICTDLKQCTMVLKRQKRQRPHDPCRTCEIIVNIARHHFNHTVYTKPDLLAQLLVECQHLAQFEGQEASAHCTQIVNQNIDKIFQDMTTPGYSARHTCEDIKECPPRTTMMPALKRQKRQRPHDPCRTCEIIVNIARHHFHNNITDQGALQAQLLVECQHLVQTESQAAADHCKMIVTNNIAKIFQDMSTNHTARQTCTDINECHAPSSPPRHK